MNTDQKLELLKSALSFVVPLVTIALGWFVGNKINLGWNLRQKQRELDLASAREFHRLYGEFCACWKLWNHALDGNGPKNERFRQQVLLRACAAEGEVESLLVQLISTRDLVAEEERKLLAQFRQAYQTLRESMVKCRKIDWHSDSLGYLHLKHGATAISRLIISDAPLDLDLVRKRFDALKEITSNKWETTKYGPSA